MSAKKKILIVGYGGTIVMVVNEERKTVEPAKNLDEILAMLPRMDEVADIDMEILANKDSANITPDDWTRLAMFIYKKHDDYDAFVITHGTNTMANTASALSLAFGDGLQKPIIITGSQLPLSVYGNDARFNFENAIKTAAEASEQGIAEVLVAFNHTVLRGSRSMKVSESAFDAFASPAFPVLADITATGIHFSHHAKKADPSKSFTINPHFNNNILSMDITPGLSPQLLEDFILSGKCKGIILKSFGAGSVPTEGTYSLIPFIKKAVDEYKVPVIVTTKFLGGNSYKEVNDECAVLALEAGAIPGGDITSVMAEAKLMWILAQGAQTEKGIREQMLTAYVGEVSSLVQD